VCQLLVLLFLACSPVNAPAPVTDSRYPYRGMHLDVARHFFSKEDVKHYLDLLAFYKFNVFHWHLTDDQGFRLELKKHPELTSVGGKDGFYTQDDVREIVAYAKARGITVVPEIEMPGHARAILAAHPELSCTGVKQDVPRTWGVFEDVMCAGNEQTFALVADILDEVVALFPGPYLHIGGDEVPKTRWSQCPKCAARMQSEHLDVDHLEGWFMERVAKMVTARGKRAMVWDEALDDRLPKDVVVIAWQSKERGSEAARRGHDVVMAPHEHLYFNYWQSKTRREPGHEGHLPWEKVRAFDPGKVLGAEGALWTEYVTTRDEMDTMVLPRMAALADALAGVKAPFPARFTAQRGELDRLGAKYFIEPPDVGLAKHVFIDRADVVVSLPPLFPDATLRGTIPKSVTETTDIETATVLPNGRSSFAVKTRYEKQTPRPARIGKAGAFDYEYFEGTFTKLPDFGTIKSVRTGTTPSIAIDPSFPAEGFAVRYSGYFEARATCVTRIVAKADDGVRVFVDDELVVEDDGVHAAREVAGEIALAGGVHALRVEYFQGTGGKSLSVAIESRD
jgi:hexosaminidase